MRPRSLELLEFGIFREEDHPRGKGGKFTAKRSGAKKAVKGVLQAFGSAKLAKSAVRGAQNARAARRGIELIKKAGGSPEATAKLASLPRAAARFGAGQAIVGGMAAAYLAAKAAGNLRKSRGKKVKESTVPRYSPALLEKGSAFSEKDHPRGDDGKFVPAAAGAGNGDSGPRQAALAGGLGVAGLSMGKHAVAHIKGWAPTMRRSTAIIAKGIRRGNPKMVALGKYGVRQGMTHLAIGAGLATASYLAAKKAAKIAKERVGEPARSGVNGETAMGAVLRGARAGARTGLAAGLGGTAAMVPLHTAYGTYHGLGLGKSAAASIATAAIGPAIPSPHREVTLLSAPVLGAGGAIVGAGIGGARAYAKYREKTMETTMARHRMTGVAVRNPRRGKGGGIGESLDPYSLALLEKGGWSERLHPRASDGKFTAVARALGAVAKSGVRGTIGGAAFGATLGGAAAGVLGKYGAAGKAMVATGAKLGALLGGTTTASRTAEERIPMGDHKDTAAMIAGGALSALMSGGAARIAPGLSLASTKTSVIAGALGGAAEIASVRARKYARLARSKKTADADRARLRLRSKKLERRALAGRVGSLAAFMAGDRVGGIGRMAARRASGAKSWAAERVARRTRPQLPGPTTIDIPRSAWRVREAYSLALLEKGSALGVGAPRRALEANRSPGVRRANPPNSRDLS